MERSVIMVDGNEATTIIAYRINEVIAIYPITPASPMGEHADGWAAKDKTNLFGVVPEVVEMQSEAGAAGAVHGSLQAGSLTTTFTASQGLLLMIPNMYKIAGELTSCVIHVAARTIATHALSIFGDQSDVMGARQTGWAMLCASTVQEAHDFSLLSQVATLESRIPFLHFFDGFRTSHEIDKIQQLGDEDLHHMLDEQKIIAHRNRALNPDNPFLRGSAQNPDVFFQAREAPNVYYDNTPDIVQNTFDKFSELTGRQYNLFDYFGAEDAEQVIVVMGSGTGAIEEVVDKLNGEGKKVGVVKVRLYRPWQPHAFLEAVPSTAKRIAVLDRTKEPGSAGEPLFQDVITTLAELWIEKHGSAMPKVIGGRYGLSSKEFNPSMVLAIYRELEKEDPKPRFTIGIIDDVTHLSLPWDNNEWVEPDEVIRAVFYGLGSDGTVGANKNSVKIIGEKTDLNAQGYFVYDSKKAGSVTISHLRFSPDEIKSTYLINQANFVACHNFQFMDSKDVLTIAEPGGTFLLNSPFGPDEIWDRIPVEAQQKIIEKNLKFYVVDGYRVAREAGMGGRINTVMQTCFFALTGIIPKDEAIAYIKDAIKKTYGSKGESILTKNYAAVDGALAALHEVDVPEKPTSEFNVRPPVPDHSPDFVKKVTGLMIAGLGDLLPVSAMPIDGTFPTATSQYEKRSIAQEIPIWDPDLCIACGLCAYVCPHAAIRTKAYPEADLKGAPDNFLSMDFGAKGWDGYKVTIQVAPEDCTGCTVCVDVCPAKSKEVENYKAINMRNQIENVEVERERYDFFLDIPELDRSKIKTNVIKESQLLQPLFEYSGACAGCGETPYLKLLTQLYGDRLLVANATGCSSIFGGNLPTTPWSINDEGRGPAWANSLFEDNAEFGIGMKLALERQEETAETLLKKLSSQIGDDLVTSLIDAEQEKEADFIAQRERVTALKEKIKEIDSFEARTLLAISDVLVKRSVWIVGGDGWAYDIGFGGLDHVLSMGRDVNILVLDTEVYSNTGGQASKATPRAATAKFAASGKGVRRKDLGMLAVDYGDVYVAQVAMGAQYNHTLKAFHEAQSYPGTSLIIAFSPCIAHGLDLSLCMSHQKNVVNSAYWPLYRYDPRQAEKNGRPFQLDSRAPKMTFREYAMTESRFSVLARSDPEEADRLFKMAQKDIDDKWAYYQHMATMERAPVAAAEGEE